MDKSAKMYDAIVVGSGPGAIFAAYALRPLNILILDVGIGRPDALLGNAPLHSSLAAPNHKLFEPLIGSDYKGAEHLVGRYISPKLKAPGMRYVWSKPDGIPGQRSRNFDPTLSYASGGLANAWGAGVLRFKEKDLIDFPITAADLDPFYDEVSSHIGISGAEDDLTPFFGADKNLHQPLPLSPLAKNFLNRYEKAKSGFNQKEIYAGRLRLAILTKVHRGRDPYLPLLHDFFETSESAIYSPRFTLKEFINSNEVEYLSSIFVTSFSESDKGIEVRAINLKSNEEQTFSCNRLFLGAGAINSARIVLNSHGDFQTRLPLLDNPVCFLPFVDFSQIGKAFPKNPYPGGELAVLNDAGALPVQASVYGLYGPLRTDIVSELPLSLGSSIRAGSYLAPAMGMLQVFLPAPVNPENHLQLNRDLSLTIENLNDSKSTESNTLQDLSTSHQERVQSFLSMLHKMKYFASKKLCKVPPPGSSIHYAGTLPMRHKTVGNYQTDSNGLLHGTKGIYVVDGANLPTLPSKNHTFTIMANAMRIGRLAKDNVAGEI